MAILAELEDEMKAAGESTADEAPQTPIEAPPATTGDGDASAKEPQEGEGAAGSDVDAKNDTDRESLGLLAAKKAETKRRQEAEERALRVERELSELRGKLEVVQSLHAPPKEAPASQDDDPSLLDNGFLSALGATAVKVAQREAFKMLKEQFARRVRSDFEELREEGEDVEAIEREFVEIVKDNPKLQERFSDSSSPGRYAARVVKRAREAREKQASAEGASAQYEAKIKELESKLQALEGRPATAQIIESNASARSVGRAPVSRASDEGLDEYERAKMRWRRKA